MDQDPTIPPEAHLAAALTYRPDSALPSLSFPTLFGATFSACSRPTLHSLTQARPRARPRAGPSDTTVVGPVRLHLKLGRCRKDGRADVYKNVLG